MSEGAFYIFVDCHTGGCFSSSMMKDWCTEVTR